MSGIKPSLECPCRGEHLQEAIRYDAAPSGETRFELGGAKYQRSYDRCGVCGHWFGRHDMDLSGLYDVSYVNATYGDAGGMRRRLEQILALPPARSDNAGRVARILARTETLPAGARRVLDVGAGIGVFPAAMKSAGWAVAALEPDPRTVQHLRDAVGVEAFTGILEEQDPEKIGRFDLITFNKVLEHIEAPVAVLAHTRRFLQPHGLVYIEVPDVAAIDGGPGREEFFLEHHHVFSPSSLAMTIERAGLVVELVMSLRDPSGKYTVIGWGRMRAVA